MEGVALDNQASSVMDAFEAAINEAIDQIMLVDVNNEDVVEENALRRKIFSRLELIRMDIEDYTASCSMKSRDVYKQRVALLSSKIDEARKLIPIIKHKAPKVWYAYFDMTFRLFALILNIFNIGVMLSIPAIFTRIIEKTLGIPVKYSVCEKFRKFCAGSFYVISAVELTLVGFDAKYFSSNSAVLTYTHSSTLDPFVVGPYIPNRIIIVAKKEIYLIPFFSWTLLACGGVAIDRGNHAKAVAAMQRSAESAKNENMCVFIAPEGTRSTDGQLLPFKKGPFHVWEQLQSPIIPVVIHGAHELWAKKFWVNNPGKVCVQCLPPIIPSEVKDRDHMMRTLRRRNLEALATCPIDLKGPISWSTRASSLILFVSMIIADYWLIRIVKYVLMNEDMYGLSASSATLFLIGLTIFTTLVLYVYAVYCAGTYSKLLRKFVDCLIGMVRKTKVEGGELEDVESEGLSSSLGNGSGSTSLKHSKSRENVRDSEIGFALGDKHSIRTDASGQIYHALQAVDPDNV